MMKCKKHPTYKAIRVPTADCEDCRRMYFDSKQGHSFTAAELMSWSAAELDAMEAIEKEFSFK